MAVTVAQVDYKSVNNTITQDTSQTSPTFVADNGVYHAVFQQTGNVVTFTKNGRSLTWAPANISYVNQSGKTDLVYAVQEVPFETKANYARINRAYPDIDDWFIVQGNQLKHQILVQGFQRDPVPFLTGPIDFVVGGTLQFDSDLRVVANGLTLTGPFETTGGIDIYDGDSLLFTLPQVVAYDSGYERTETTGKYRVTENADGKLAFDIIVDNAWMSSTDRIYPIVIDPTVVVSSSYDTSGNGARRIVRLANNWQITAAGNGTSAFYLYKSADNGQTWSQLCSVNTSQVSVSLASLNNTVYIVWHDNTTTAKLYFVSFDATTQTNVDISGSRVQIDSSTSSGYRCSLAIDGTGALHVAWSCKVAAYPNSNNIRYIKSTNGGVTWSTPTQVSKQNSTGINFQSPSLVINSSNVPYIFVGDNQGNMLVTSTNISGLSIYMASWESTWGNKVVYNAGVSNYNQTNSCAVVDSNDVIHVVWLGAINFVSPATGNGYRPLYSKSTDGGTTWSGATNVGTALTQASHDDEPTMTCDSSNQLYVFFGGMDFTYSNSYWNIKKNKWNGSAWSGPSTITSNTTNNAYKPNALFSKFNMNSSDAVRWIYQDQQAASVKYDSITLNSPPNAPILTPEPNFDATIAQTLNWTFSDPDTGNTQSAYQLQILDVAANTTVIDTGKVASTAGAYTLPANTLTNGKQYQWKVTTWDNSGVQGPYSNYSTFSTAAAPTVTITSPTASQVVPTSSLTTIWSYSDPGSNAQQSYAVQLLDASNNVLWDSGTVISANNMQTIQYVLANNTTYKVKVTATSSKGVSSASVVQTFSVSYTPPAVPTLNGDTGIAYNTITITNPTPTGSQPTVTGNDLYRRSTGSSTWTRIAANLPNNGSYHDYTVAANKTYDYYVQANGNNGTSVNSATITSSALMLLGNWIHAPSNPAGTILNVQLQLDYKKDQWTPTVVPMKFAGRSKPVMAVGEQDDFTLTPQKLVFMSESDYLTFLTLAKMKTTLCWRDGRGRKVFGMITDVQNQDDSFGHVVDVTFVEVDFSEVV